VDETMVDFHGT